MLLIKFQKLFQIRQKKLEEIAFHIKIFLLDVDKNYLQRRE